MLNAARVLGAPRAPLETPQRLDETAMTAGLREPHDRRIKLHLRIEAVKISEGLEVFLGALVIARHHQRVGLRGPQRATSGSSVVASSLT